MKAKDLIKELEKFPEDMEVCIADWRKNAFNANDEPQGHGIDDDFTVELIDENVNTPFIALSFVNDDYSEDGEPNEGSLIYDVISRQVKN